MKKLFFKRKKKPIGKSAHYALVGIDGSGKSTSYDRLMKMLATDMKVAGIGDNVLVSNETGGLVVPKDLMHVRIKATMNVVMRVCRQKFLYQIGKLLDLIERSKVRDSLHATYNPEIIITDGSPLITMLGWVRHNHPTVFSEKEYSKLIYYLTKKGRLTVRESFHYLRRIPELYAIRNVYGAQLRIPDKVIFLRVDVESALERIKGRVQEQQIHDQVEYLKQLQESYAYALKVLQTEYAVPVFEIDTSNLRPEEVISECFGIIMPGEDAVDMNVIATSVFGGERNWRKLGMLEGEFKKYHASSKVFIVDSQQQAYARTKASIVAGGKWLIAAGGAGTFNSVLEGCCAYGPPGENMKLGFLRKGSADLIGRVLKIPDNLHAGVKVICEAIKNDTVVESDVLEVYVTEEGAHRKFHMVGFSGVGIFGDIPYFTEGKFIKYYKNVFSTLFGERGKLLTGANMAIARHYLKKRRRRKVRYNIIAEGRQMSSDEYSSILVLNGDLGKHFPVARGVALGSGDFQVVLLKEGGLKMTYRQIIHAWKGDLADYRDELGVEIFRTNYLKIIPEEPENHYLNLDGALKRTHGEIEYSLYGKIKLISG